MIDLLKRMVEFKKGMISCEICEKYYVAEISSKEKGDSADHVELVSVRYNDHWYAGCLAENARWLEWDICPQCFFEKLLPAMYQAGLPRKKMDGLIA